MPITGELKIDPDFFTENLRESPNGFQGLRNYRVNTILTASALFADGVPKRGDFWGDPILNLAGLKVTERETFLMGGRDSGDGTGGWTRVQILYETPNASPFRIPTDPNDQWTEISIGRGQFNQIDSLGRLDGSNEHPASTAIANGDGCAVDFGIVEARVFTFRPLAAPVDQLDRMLGLCRPSKINDAELRLPRLYGHAQPLVRSKGQVRYVSFEPSVVGTLLQIVHVLELAPNFYFRWREKDAAGQPVGTVRFDRVYEYANFDGLWRQ